jgi:acylpyruvate hydrolase
MKLVTYRAGKELHPYRMGSSAEGQIIDLQEAYRHFLLSEGEVDLAMSVASLLPADPQAFYQMGSQALKRAYRAEAFARTERLKAVQYRADEVKVGPPVPKPGKIICVGLNYKDHIEEMGRELPEYPVLFGKFANAVCAHDQGVYHSKLTEKLDYEGELAVVIGRRAQDVPEKEAMQYIAGYTIANDVTARDLQRRTPQFLQGKTLDRSAPMGPYLVTADEIEDVSNLSIRTFVNGEKRQDSNTGQLIFSVPYLVSFISEIMTLEPGDIIMTGTPNGVGFAMHPPQFLKEGDVVEIEIEGLGQLRNHIIPKPSRL